MKWHYKSIRLALEFGDHKSGEVEQALTNLDTQLAEAGQDGWELVSTLQTEASGYTRYIVAILKRPQD